MSAKISGTERLPKPQFDVSIFHSPCPDGVCANWVVERYNPDIQRFPINHPSIALPENVEGKRIVILDYCYPRDIIISLAAKAKTITILDHHDTAEKELRDLDLPNVEIVFDQKRSGCQIAWDYMHADENGVTKGVKRVYPWFLDVIADRDMWWKLNVPNSKEISAAFKFIGTVTYNGLENLYKTEIGNELLKSVWTKEIHISIGKCVIENDKKQIENAVKYSNVCTLKIPGDDRLYKVRLAKVDDDPTLRSEIGNILSEKCFEDGSKPDFACTYRYDFVKDEWWMSTRRGDTSTLNLADLCGKFPRPEGVKKGGGHPPAAGFTIYGSLKNNLHTFFTLLDEK
jgi:oligoribonuclease NrnB/cAMP/cGMP phosphodiesterase (DHH superfamily)